MWVVIASDNGRCWTDSIYYAVESAKDEKDAINQAKKFAGEKENHRKWRAYTKGNVVEVFQDYWEG